MGVSASIMESQKGEVASALKSDYENCIKKGLSDEDTLLFLRNKYEAMMANIEKRNNPPKTKGKFQRRPTQVSKQGKNKGGVRRRSFGQESPTHPNRKAMSPEMAQSESTPVLPTADVATDAPQAQVEQPPPQADTWDSVVEQPYCEVCKMAFQSASKYDRHVKFSSLHAQTVAKKEKAANKKVEEPAEPTVKKQTEGVEYRLMYSGSKFFWRQKSDIEFHMYMHTLSHTVEIIPFDIARSRELARIYLDRYAMDVFVKEDAMEHTKAKISASTMGGRYSNKMTDEQKENMLEEQKRVLLATHVMARMQMDGTGADIKIAYLPLSGDPDTKCVLDAPNSALVPVPVVRRRRTSNEEISNKLNDLALDQEKLAKATNRAQKMAELMQGSVGGFQEALKMKRQKSTVNLSKWAQKWQWACHRVVLQLAVESYTRQWQAWEEKQKNTKATSKIGLAKDV